MMRKKKRSGTGRLGVWILVLSLAAAAGWSGTFCAGAAEAPVQSLEDQTNSEMPSEAESSPALSSDEESAAAGTEEESTPAGSEEESPSAKEESASPGSEVESTPSQDETESSSSAEKDDSSSAEEDIPETAGSSEEEPLPALKQVQKVRLKSTADRTIKVTWKTQKAAEGYEVCYSSDSSMKKKKTVIVPGGNQSSVTLRKLDVHTVCYVTVRALRRGKELWIRGPFGKVVGKRVTGKMIVIDPGHQENANYAEEPVGPGAHQTKMKVTAGTMGVATRKLESVLVLEVSLKLRNALEKEGYQVKMTRTTQKVNLSNVERAKFANQWKADAFIRVHADSSDSSYASGVTTICPTSRSPYPVRKLYKKSYQLSRCILDGVCKATGANNRGVFASDDYSGINWAEVPVTILEMGYMSNYTEDRLMATASYQDKIIKGIVNGLKTYFKKK